MFNFEKVQLISACKLHSSIEMVCKKKFKHWIYAYMKHAKSFSNFEACVGMKQMIESSQLNHIWYQLHYLEGGECKDQVQVIEYLIAWRF
jgi:hypothetical protein